MEQTKRKMAAKQVAKERKILPVLSLLWHCLCLSQFDENFYIQQEFWASRTVCKVILDPSDRHTCDDRWHAAQTRGQGHGPGHLGLENKDRGQFYNIKQLMMIADDVAMLTSFISFLKKT